MTLLRVLALVTDAYGGRGGIAQYNRDFLTMLAETGATSSITVLPRNAPDPVVTPPAIKQARHRSGRIAYILAALRIALSERADVVFCGHLYSLPLAWLIARLSRARLVVQTHGIEAWPRPSWLNRITLEDADLVLCVSRYTRACILGWARIAPERVLVLPNTVSESFTPGEASALRAAWQLEGKRVLLTVGRMDSSERYKGHDRVIAAIPYLVASGHDIVYVVLGGGDDVARLKVFAENQGIAERVRFMGSAKLPTLIAAYRMADVFVMPSTGEGFGIAFLEAMACGTPALGLAVAGARDALADGELGVAAADSDFSSTLARMLDGPKPDGTALAAAVRDRFGRKSFGAGVSAVFKRVSA